ncbi:GroES-like protein [Zopfia rhizophila CBS 207.26]|uniref:GroES-like protein n=1 Tax=Zopfia rhizophila CBS 207.26 TaxID=1314779 RepID=A0A6A6ELW6_9PEZI|nr:GroES-like protein [Zopfia rhizophila CBS 207.26]
MSLGLNATMRGVVYNGVPFEMTVQDLPVPQIINQTDAIVRITTSAICGSDLHIYRGVSGGTPPWNMGHEAMGYIAEIGSVVSSLSVGDYVIIPDTPSRGHLELNPRMGDYFGNGVDALPQGLQSEYARVPFADDSLIPIPLTRNTTNSTIEADYLTISDIWATAWAALDYSQFKAGDSVAVFGTGPVGLLAAYSAILRGASRVYSIDHVEARLERAASIGAIPINFVESDPVAQILAQEPEGVTRSVDCVGMESLNSRLELEEDIVVQQMVAVTRWHGGLGQVGVHLAQPNSPGAPNGATISPNITFPMSGFFGKGLTFQSGPVDPKEHAAELVELIATGKANPGFISSATIGVEEAPEYYDRFNRVEDIKVYINFP